MTGAQIAFYLFGLGAVLCSAAVILPPLGRNPIHSAMSLIVSFFFLAGCYAMLDAHLLAAMQIIVYAGAVMVLFTFVIMLLNLGDEELGQTRIRISKILAAGLVFFIVGKATTAFYYADSPPTTSNPAAVRFVRRGREVMVHIDSRYRIVGIDRRNTANPADDRFVLEGTFGSIKGVGRMLYTSFMVPFELVSVLLLVAAVGAVVLAKRRLGAGGASGEESPGPGRASGPGRLT